MNKPMLCYKYADRSVKNSTEKAISELGKLKQFDMNIATTDAIIGGHCSVLSMFSKYFRDVVSSAPPHNVIIAYIQFPSKLVSSLLELFYESSVVIDPEDREPFESLLKQMRVGDVKRSVVMDANRSLGAKIEMVRAGGNVDMRSMSRPVGSLPLQSGLEIRPVGRIGGSLKHKQEMDKKSTFGQKIDITPARIVAENNGAGQSDNDSNNGVKYTQSQMPARQRKPTPVDPNLGIFSASTEPIKKEAEEEYKHISDSEDGGEGDAQSGSSSEDMDVDSECSRKQNA